MSRLLVNYPISDDARWWAQVRSRKRIDIGRTFVGIDFAGRGFSSVELIVLIGIDWETSSRNVDASAWNIVLFISMSFNECARNSGCLELKEIKVVRLACSPNSACCDFQFFSCVKFIMPNKIRSSSDFKWFQTLKKMVKFWMSIVRIF